MTDETSREDIPRHLRWRSRRGMRELDVLLARWLEGAWRQADDGLRSAYEALLDCEDDQLWDWMLGRSEPVTAPLRRIIREIRSISVDRD